MLARVPEYVEPAPWHPLDGVPPPHEVPFTWDPGHVAHRMIKAYEVLASMPVRVGPRQHANAWPSMLTEFADLASEEAWKNHLSNAFNGDDTPRWSSEEIGLAEEALSWAMCFMQDIPLKCDALQIWAYAKATRRSVARLLRTRARHAGRAAEAATMAENMRRYQLRRTVAQVTARWANERLAGLTDPVRINAVRFNAHIRFERECAALVPVNYRPKDVMRDRILTRSALDHHLPAALDTLSNRLAKAGVPVR